MPENTDSLILEHLRLIRADIGSVKEETREVKVRLTNLEPAVAGLRREVAELYGEVVTQHARYDRIAERIERMEKRLGLNEP